MSGILEELISTTDAMENATLLDSPAEESEIVLEAIRSECSSDEEFANLVQESAIEMALYGVINDAEMATEAAKKIIVTDWKAANFQRIARRTAVRMSAVANDPLYGKYKLYRDKFITTRNAIYKKYGARANKEAKLIIKNARKRAAAMPSTAGKSIGEKIDKSIAAAEARTKK